MKANTNIFPSQKLDNTKIKVFFWKITIYKLLDNHTIAFFFFFFNHYSLRFWTNFFFYFDFLKYHWCLNFTDSGSNIKKQFHINNLKNIQGYRIPHGINSIRILGATPFIKISVANIVQTVWHCGIVKWN